jgi:hypothetical protein
MQWFARNEHEHGLSTLSLCLHLNGFEQAPRKPGQII